MAEDSTAQAGGSSDEKCGRIAYPYVDTTGHQKYTGNFAAGCFTVTFTSNRPDVFVDLFTDDDFGRSDGITKFCAVYTAQAPVTVFALVDGVFTWPDGRRDEFRYWELNGVRQVDGEGVGNPFLRVEVADGQCQNAKAVYGEPIIIPCGDALIEVNTRIWIRCRLNVSFVNDCLPCNHSKPDQCAEQLYYRFGPLFYADFVGFNDVTRFFIWDAGVFLPGAELCTPDVTRHCDDIPELTCAWGNDFDPLLGCGTIAGFVNQVTGWNSQIKLRCRCGSGPAAETAGVWVEAFGVTRTCNWWRLWITPLITPGESFLACRRGVGGTFSGCGGRTGTTNPLSPWRDVTIGPNGVFPDCQTAIDALLFPRIRLNLGDRTFLRHGGCLYPPGLGTFERIIEDCEVDFS